MILSTDSHLKNACPLDFHVKLAIYPDTNDFYFRIGLDDEVDSQGNWFGDFDFTANTATQSLIQKMIKKHFSFEIASEFSKKYFDEVYGG